MLLLSTSIDTIPASCLQLLVPCYLGDTCIARGDCHIVVMDKDTYTRFVLPTRREWLQRRLDLLRKTGLFRPSRRPKDAAIGGSGSSSKVPAAAFDASDALAAANIPSDHATAAASTVAVDVPRIASTDARWCDSDLSHLAWVMTEIQVSQCLLWHGK